MSDKQQVSKGSKKPPKFLRKVYLSERELEFILSKIEIVQKERESESWKTKMVNKLVNHHLKAKESREKNNK